MKLANLTSNFFELFGMPVAFSIDQTALVEQYRRLQYAVHPDKFAHASDYERRLSVQQSARINEAFQTLKEPLSRARYLLGLYGKNLDDKNVMDPQFLVQQMELREKIEVARSGVDPVRGLAEIGNVIATTTMTLATELGVLFEKGAEANLDIIFDQVLRLQFMVRLEEEIASLEETLV